MNPAKVIVADPPWHFGDKLPGNGRGASKHYGTLSVAEICSFPRPPSANDALLVMWRVAAMQSAALDVIAAWGFTPKSEIVWVKTAAMPICGPDDVRMGMGRYVRNSHEVAIVATRGRPVIRDHAVRSVLFAPRGRHSEKPEQFFDLVERLSEGPYVELFARRHRTGWMCYGDELAPMEQCDRVAEAVMP